MTKAPYTIAEYEALARRIPYRDGDAMTFTAREWDTIFTALGMAVAHELRLARLQADIEAARKVGADI